MAALDIHVPVLQLNDGHTVPQLAFGVGTALARPSDDAAASAVVEAIKLAIKEGYRHFDAAENYKNEAELGRAIQESGVPRGELFITTKIGRASNDVTTALDASLERLGLEYVDLYLIHSPFFDGATDEEKAEHIQHRWKQMEQVQASGKARSIGVSNYMRKHLEATLATATIVPAINQIEFHPYLQHGDLLAFLQDKGILMAAYGPLAPVRGAQGGPLDAVLPKLAAKYQVTESEICLRYVVEKGGVAITTSTKAERMRNYKRAVSFSLTPQEMIELDVLGSQMHHRAFFRDRYAPDDRT